MTTRIFAYVVLACLALFVSPPAGAINLKVAAWNLEHLDDTAGAGCVGRRAADYAALAQQIADLGADIVAFQEVENIAAAHRVFPAAQWNVEISRRPPAARTRACWDRRHAQLGHLATGIAIRRGIAYRRNRDLRALDAGKASQRWGTDITVTLGREQLRLLSVHLASGCWGAKQDHDPRRKGTCGILRHQIEHLRAWADAGRTAGTPFVILGDFNRRLTLGGDWAWHLLSPSPGRLKLLTRGEPFGCDRRYRAFIDHMIAGGGAEAMATPGSFREAPRRGPHPDHCAISAIFRIRS